MRRPTPDNEKVLMGAPFAHLRFEQSPEDAAPVLYLKLPSDVLKALLLDAKLALLATTVTMHGHTLDVIGVSIDDVPGDPFRYYQPLTEAGQLSMLRACATATTLHAYVFNEMVIPTFEMLLAPVLPAESFLQNLAPIKPGQTPPPIPAQETALDAVVHLAAKTTRPSESQVKPLSFLQLQSSSLEIYKLTLPPAGDFDPDDKNEGGNLEQSVQVLLATRYSSGIYRSPQVDDGASGAKRELTDVLLVTPDALFLFESKVMAVLERGLSATSERRVKVTTKHFKKALGQLTGAVKRIREGATIHDATERPIGTFDSVPAIHATIVVTAQMAGLDFRNIATHLTEAGKQINACFHFLDLGELQQLLAFTNDSRTLSAYMDRRYKVVTGSGNAAIRSIFRHTPPRPTTSPEISADHSGHVMAFGLAAGSEPTGSELCAALFKALRHHSFSGRCELYHQHFDDQGEPLYALALVLRPSSSPTRLQNKDLQAIIAADLSNARQPSWGFTFLKHLAVLPLKRIRLKFEPVLAMDFQAGEAIASNNL
ncbi:MAG: hypothetical protein ABSE16_10855 [Verrucomicrobiota bacterium]|jgi:hypothetical protein